MKKTFDCVKMKNDIQAAMYAEMKNMTPEEQLEYIKRRAKDFWKKMGIDRLEVKEAIPHGKYG